MMPPGRRSSARFRQGCPARPPSVAALPLRVEVHIVPSTRAPTGIGESAVPLIAPAVCNAIFAATGVRIRGLPVDASLLAS